MAIFPIYPQGFSRIRSLTSGSSNALSFASSWVSCVFCSLFVFCLLFLSWVFVNVVIARKDVPLAKDQQWPI